MIVLKFVMCVCVFITEHILVRSWWLLFVSHPQHHHVGQTCQILPQNGHRGCIWGVSACTHTHYHCLTAPHASNAFYILMPFFFFLPDKHFSFVLDKCSWQKWWVLRLKCIHVDVAPALATSLLLRSDDCLCKVLYDRFVRASTGFPPRLQKTYPKTQHGCEWVCPWEIPWEALCIHRDPNQEKVLTEWIFETGHTALYHSNSIILISISYFMYLSLFFFFILCTHHCISVRMPVSLVILVVTCVALITPWWSGTVNSYFWSACH